MRIVIFHGDLTQPSGGEVNARDWAFGFKARGHKVSIYSPRLGPLAEQIRQHGITVVNDPSAISDAPDVMMGQGVHELAALVARFPRAAGVQVAQLYGHWNSSPCPLPQVVLHLAVDELNAEMLANEFGVARDRIRIVYNAVDLARIAPRTLPPRPRPQRMLVFAKAQSDYLPAIREACAARNIAVECVGGWIGRPIANPLEIVRDYDLVCGSARTALEGAACGAAVLVADGRGLAGMLTTANFDHFRRNNFGREILTRPLKAELIGEEIDRYDAADACKVSEIVLATAGLDRQLEQIEKIFAEAVDLLARARPTEEAVNQALASYLAKHLPRAGEGEPSPRHGQPDHLGLGVVNERVSAVAQDVAGVQERVSAIAQDIAAVAQGMNGLEQRVSAIGAHCTDIERDLAPAVALAAAFDRNRPLLNLLRPFARIVRSIPGMRGRR
jgi:hypothetical protein